MPKMVVVGPVEEAAPPFPPFPPLAPPAPELGALVAYTVAVLVCLIVVVTTVVDEPEPRVYVRVVSDPGEPAPPLGDDPLPPVPIGIEAEGVITAPPLPVVVADGEDPAGPVGTPEANEERIAELADEACSTGQTV